MWDLGLPCHIKVRVSIQVTSMEHTHAIVKSCLDLQHYISKLEEGGCRPKIMEDNVKLKTENVEIKKMNTRLSHDIEKLKERIMFYEDRDRHNKQRVDQFIDSYRVKIGKDLFVPQKVFVQVFNQHCQSNNLGRFPFTPETYSPSFAPRNIKVGEEEVVYRGRAYPKQSIIYGLDVVE